MGTMLHSAGTPLDPTLSEINPASLSAHIAAKLIESRQADGR
jgi:hypothetical protein